MRGFALLLIAGCGRIGFDAPADATADAREVTSGLVAHLPLDVLAVGATPDATGHGHGATCDDSLTRCPVIVAGRLGNAVRFDGNDDRLAIDDAPDLHLPDAFTISAWIELDTPPSGNGCPYQKVVGTQDQDSWELCFRPDLTGYYFSSESLFSGNGNQLDVPALAFGAWVHTAITWDRITRTKQVFYGGILVAFTMGVALTPLFDGQPILLGLDLDNGGTSSAFAGAVDDLRIYDRVLTADELATLATP